MFKSSTSKVAVLIVVVVPFIVKLPATVRLGVYTAYRYYSRLLDRLKNTPPLEIKNSRIRVPNYEKIGLVAQSYFEIKFQRV